MLRCQWPMQATSAAPQSVGQYERRRPAKSALYLIIDTHYEAVLAQAHGAGYPAFVRNEFERAISPTTYDNASMMWSGGFGGEPSGY